MDIVSHAIVGRMLVTKKKNSRKDIWLVSLFGALPDFFQFPLYLYLGYLNQRPFWYPLNSDWIGFRAAQPTWMLWWDIPHSFLTLLFVVAPIVFLLKLNKLVLLAYFLHIFLDLFTHTGEWGVKPFFPFQFMVNGFTDAWAWDPGYFPVAWAALWMVLILVEKIRSR